MHHHIVQLVTDPSTIQETLRGLAAILHVTITSTHHVAVWPIR